MHTIRTLLSHAVTRNARKATLYYRRPPSLLRNPPERREGLRSATRATFTQRHRNHHWHKVPSFSIYSTEESRPSRYFSCMEFFVLLLRASFDSSIASGWPKFLFSSFLLVNAYTKRTYISRLRINASYEKKNIEINRVYRLLRIDCRFLRKIHIICKSISNM